MEVVEFNLKSDIFESVWIAVVYVIKTSSFYTHIMNFLGSLNQYKGFTFKGWKNCMSAKAL